MLHGVGTLTRSRAARPGAVRARPADECRPGAAPPGRSSGRLLVVSNRLPIVLVRAPEERGWRVRPAAGGLVTAMEPVLRRHRGVWIGWPGVPSDALDIAGPREGEDTVRRALAGNALILGPVSLTRTEVERFYHGFSNRTLWPLLHGLPARCEHRAEWREAYGAVNRRFAGAVATTCRPDDFVWVHDYHLLEVGRELRAAGVSNRTAFFLHTPFPPPHLLAALPGHRQLLTGLLAYDFVGFQTARDRRNYAEAAGLAEIPWARSRWVGARADEHEAGVPSARSGVFPISIDYDAFADGARRPTVAARAAEIRRQAGGGTLLLGVDRLDYTKAVAERLRGFREALRRHPELRGGVTLLQLVVPSREEIPEYRDTRREIEDLVDGIRAEFGRHGEGGWTPVRYEYGSWDRPELLAHYRAADVALVTPLRDGMNLVAKEFCAARGGRRGVLVLSAFAGAAEELGEAALVVDPRSPRDVAEAIHRACTMPAEERRRRSAVARARIEAWDVHRWAGEFLRAAGAGTAVEGPRDSRAGTARPTARIPVSAT